MKKNLRWTPEELEQLTLHELAELMGNIVIVLRRMPDVPISDLLSTPAVSGLVGKIRRRAPDAENAGQLPDWVE